MAFSFSSAINNLVAGAAENVADVVTCFNDVKAVLNNGITGTDHLSASANIVGSQLSASAAIADTQLASPNNVTYKQIIPSVVFAPGIGGVGSVNSGNTYLLNEGNVVSTPPLPTVGTAGMSVFYIDPADYTAGSKANKYRLRVSFLQNATAGTPTFTLGLYPVTAVAGGSGAVSVTLGAVTAGSTVAFVAPGANTLNQANSGDFTAPVAGYYAIGCAVTVASQAGNQAAAARAILQHRQV